MYGWWECKLINISLGNWQYPLMLNICISVAAAILVLCINPTEIDKCMFQKTCLRIL